MLCPLPHLLQGVLGQAVLCIVSLSLTVLCQKSERKPKRPKKSPRGQGVLEQRFYTANSSSLQETGEASKSPREKTLHREQLQSSRDCGSRRVKKEGSTQQPKLSLQETVEASTSPRVKKEDSTQRTAPVCKRLLEQKHLQER